MGISTDAYLFFGIELNDMDNEWKVRGPLLEYAEVNEMVPKDEAEDWGTGCLLDMILSNLGSGLDYGSHGSGEYPAYYVCTDNFMAWRGSATEINPTVFEKGRAADIEKLETFCKEVGLEFKQPRWILASYWG